MNAQLLRIVACLMCAYACARLFTQPLRELTLEDLRLPVHEAALVVGLTMLAHTLRPAIGLAVDLSARRGGDPRRFVRIAAALGTLAALASTLARSPARALPAFAVAVAGAVVVELVTSAALAAEQARGTRSSLLGAARSFGTIGVTLVLGVVAGWVAEAPQQRLGLLVGGFMALALAIAATMPRASLPTPAPASRPTALSRPAIEAALLAFVFFALPGFSTLLFEYQKQLGYSQVAIGALESFNNLFGIAGVFLYHQLRRRLTLRTMLPLAIVAYALSEAPYLYYYDSRAVLAIEGFNGLLSALGLATMSETMLRGAGSEGRSFTIAVILCTANIGVLVSEIVGARLPFAAGLSFAQVVLLQSACHAALAIAAYRLAARRAWLRDAT